MRSFRKKLLCYCATSLLMSTIAFEIQADDSDIKIDFSDEGINIVAEEKKMSDVLIKLGHLTDIEITGADTIDAMFDGQIASADIEELLKLLGVSSILVWDDSEKEHKLKEIILLSVSSDGSSFLPAGDTGAISTTNSLNTSQQPVPESSPNSQRGAADLNLNTQKPLAAGTTHPDDAIDDSSTNSGTAPGFKFSIDPNSATINPQQ